MKCANNCYLKNMNEFKKCNVELKQMNNEVILYSSLLNTPL